MTTSNTSNQEIIRIHNDIYKALLEKNRDGLTTQLHRQFSFTSADAVLMDKQLFVEGFAMNPGIRFTVLASADEKVVIAGKTAVLTAIAHITITKGDKTQSMDERVTETYISGEKGWVLLGMQATYMVK
ncbi:nuclear transport factor 2 family protein [Chitinophaga oryzae]|uniref:Nuclear transport factor 2 family protein n=1 Tax=Chitinophaga oryzae TaxID=2725414 RepID=A0AAE7D908_9BACT|nr:nuclear transport factor 2 family protein [Chitinophaga oryzae]QJB32688.1 nuclear transport factor 2 family protein [Chitinophaga oryzae]